MFLNTHTHKCRVIKWERRTALGESLSRRPGLIESLRKASLRTERRKRRRRRGEEKKQREREKRDERDAVN